MFNEYCGLLAGVVSAFAFVPYLYSITQGTKPSLATWTIWTIVGLLTCSSYLSANEGWVSTAWVAVVYVIAPFITALMTWWYGARYTGLDTVEIVCMCGALCGVFIWLSTHSAFAALMVFIVIDCVGVVPTVVKSFRDPYSESLLAWSCSLVGCSLNLCAIEVGHWSIAEASYPVYLALSVWMTCATIVFRRRIIPAGFT